MKRLSTIVLAAAGALSGASAHAAYVITSITMTDLGTLGGAESEAHDINDAGHIVGTSQNSSAISRGFFYSNGVMTDVGLTLGALPSVAHGINNSDQVVGWWSDASGHHAYRWQSGTIVPLDPGPPILSLVESEAEAIADNGRIVGQRQYNDVYIYSATMWTDLTSPFTLDPWSESGYIASRVSDVDEKGRATGWSYFGHQDRVWNYFGPLPVSAAVAPPLPISGYTYFEASPNGVHEKAGIVGNMRFYYNLNPDTTFTRAFYWANGAINAQILGVMPGGNFSTADDINSQRFIVGWSEYFPQVQQPMVIKGFIYHSDFGMVGLPLGNYKNCRARALNERNQSGFIYVAGYCDGLQGKRAVRWNVRVSATL